MEEYIKLDDLDVEKDGRIDMRNDQIVKVDDFRNKTVTEQASNPVFQQLRARFMMNEYVTKRFSMKLCQVLVHPSTVGIRSQYHRLVMIVIRKNARITGTGTTFVTCLVILWTGTGVMSINL